MSKFGRPDNFIDNLELLFRRARAKLKRVQAETSSSQLEAPLSNSEVKPSICNGTAQIIRTKVQKQSPEQLNSRT
jgi:hypothetical protein